MTLYSKLTIKADGESAGLRKLSQRIRMSLARGRVEAHPVSDEEPAAKLDDPPGAEPEHKSPAIPDKPDDLPISDAEYAIMRDATARQDNVALIVRDTHILWTWRAGACAWPNAAARMSISRA